MKTRVSELKKTPFKIWDVAIYALIAALIAFLFLSTRPQRSGTVEVLVAGERVLVVDLEDGDARVCSPLAQKTGEGEYRISAGGGYNVVTVNYDGKSVSVTDADCGGDCLSMRIEDGAIICAPHGLVVKYSGEELSPKVG